MSQIHEADRSDRSSRSIAETGSPAPQTHLRGDDLDIQTAYETWIDRTVGARAPITAFYAGYRAAITAAEGK